MADTYYDANDQPIATQYFDADDKPIPPQSLLRKPPKEFGIAKVAKEALPDALPMLGSAFGPEGTIIGALAKQVISPSNSLKNAAIDVGSNVAVNTLPQAVSKAFGYAAPTIREGIDAGKRSIAKLLGNKFVGKIFPSVGEAVTQAKGAQLADQYLKPEVNTIEDAAAQSQGTHQQMSDIITAQRKLHPDIPATSSYTSSLTGQTIPGTPKVVHPNVQSAIDSRGNIFDDNAVGGKLNRIPPTQLGGSDASIKEAADLAMKDASQARNFKFATGGDQQFTDLASSRAIRAGYVPGGRFDANKILDELNGAKSDIYNEMNPQVKDNLTNVLNALKESKLTKNLNPTVKYLGRRMAFDLLGFGGAPGIAAGATMYVGDYALGKIASSPEMSQLIIAGTKTSKNTPAGQFIQKAIKYQLPRILGEGAKLTYRNADGEEDEATVQNGQITTVPAR